MSKHFFSRLAALSAAEQVEWLQLQSEDVLRAIERACAPPECDCELVFLPCPKHGEADCDCTNRPYVPCGVHTTVQTPLTFGALAFLRWTLHPDLYVDPPPPLVPSRCMVPEAKAVVFAQRAAAGMGLYHPEDYIFRRRPWDPETWLGLERTISTKETNPLLPANGHAVPGKVARR